MLEITTEGQGRLGFFLPATAKIELDDRIAQLSHALTFFSNTLTFAFQLNGVVGQK